MTDDPVSAFRTAILAALGAAPDDIEHGRLHRFSLNGKRDDTAGWCQLFADGRAGVFGNWRDGSQCVWSAVDRRRMTRAQSAELARQVLAAKAVREAERRARWGEAAGRLAQLWAQCRPVQADGSGTDPVTLYLRHRLALAPDEALQVPRVIRLHPGLAYHHDGEPAGRWPAMVAVIHDHDGAAVALHRTWLTPEGRKAPTPGPVKKLTSAAGPVMGGCIRLAWPGAVNKCNLLGIAEGIETALAARQASAVPTVAAYSAGALAAWKWPPDLRRLVIFADADAAGAEAAAELSKRARSAGLAVQVLAPSETGTDWCDVWAQRGAVSIESRTEA